VSILTDALLMRMTLVPALLTVLRERSWAIPAWLEKALPNITIEAPGERASRGTQLPHPELEPEPRPASP
jgi:RND superfamily putative drug exporter